MKEIEEINLTFTDGSKMTIPGKLLRYSYTEERKIFDAADPTLPEVKKFKTASFEITLNMDIRLPTRVWHTQVIPKW